MERFRRPGLGERFAQLGYLLKHTVTIIGRDADILAPVIRMVIYAGVLVTLFFAMIWAYVEDASTVGTVLLLLFLILFVYQFFYYNRQELAMSWLVYETAAGRDRDLGDASEHVKTLTWQARILALLDMGAAWIAWRSRSGGKGGFLTGALMSALTEGWDLVNHFLLPAFAIEGVGFRDGMARLKATRENVPETLMGVFGIDVLGRLVITIVAPIYTLLVLAGIVVGTWLATALPGAFLAGEIGELLPPEVLAWLPVTAESQFNWLPLLVCIFLGKLASAIFARLVVALKVIYFTLFYTRTLHAGALADDIRAELDRYLTFSDGASGDDPEGAQGPAPA